MRSPTLPPIRMESRGLPVASSGTRVLVSSDMGERRPSILRIGPGPPTDGPGCLWPDGLPEGFRLGPLELVLADRASVTKVCEPSDLVGRSTTSRAGNVLDVLTKRGLLRLRVAHSVLLDLVAAGDQVNEDAEVGQDDDEYRPQGLAPAR